MSKSLSVVLGLAVLIAVGYIFTLRGQIRELNQRLAVAESAAETGAVEPPTVAVVAADTVQQSTGGRVLSDWQRTALVDTLSAGGSNAGSPVWFTTVPNNPEAAAFEKTLRGLFEEAGWEVKGRSAVGFSMKSGLYVFAADEVPPPYFSAVGAAFEAAGIPLASLGLGYRAYYNERKAENPNWIGFSMADDQSFVVVVGRDPDGDIG